MNDRTLSSCSTNLEQSGAQPLTISDLSGGETGIISKLDGGKKFKARLAALGFTIGAQVTVLRNLGYGPVIVSILGTHIALGRGEANRIQVKQP